jgi:CheY-like chemotaxis protein
MTPFARLLLVRVARVMPKILLIEDNEMNRLMLDRRLRQVGHSVVMAVDGEQGYALAIGEKPDLILMDVWMPGTNGLQATQRLKATQQTRQIPIVILTADPSNREQAFAAGCDAYATKPIGFVKLREMIDNLLAKAQIQKSASPLPGLLLETPQIGEN